MRKNNEQCYLCRRSTGVKLTRNHVPPACLFPKPRPSELITLPCCTDCQKEHQKDEEYFRTNISTISDVRTNEKAKATWQKAYKSLSRGPQLLKELTSRLAPVDIETPLGTTRAIWIPQDRTNKILKKIALGLFYHHTKSRLPDDFEVQIYLQQTEYFPFPDLLRKSRYVGRFKNTFCYGGVFAEDGSSMWVMCFYRSVSATVIFRPPMSLSISPK